MYYCLLEQWTIWTLDFTLVWHEANALIQSYSTPAHLLSEQQIALPKLGWSGRHPGSPVSCKALVDFAESSDPSGQPVREGSRCGN